LENNIRRKNKRVYDPPHPLTSLISGILTFSDPIPPQNLISVVNLPNPV
jgi:hypothetical protein